MIYYYKNENYSVSLMNSKGYDWSVEGKVILKGYFLYEGRHICDNFKIAQLFSSCDNIASLEKILSHLDGCYCGLINLEYKILIFTDNIRSFPILYSYIGDRWHITDSLSTYLEQQVREDLTSTNLAENSLFFVENRTFYRNIKQVPSGTIIEISKKCIIKKYWDFSYKTIQNLSFEKNLRRVCNFYNELFEQYSPYIKNRQLIVPLSGGHDSRLILHYLCKYEYTSQILAYSYGNESVIAEKIANYYKVRFIRIPVRHVEMLKIYKHHAKQYYMYAGNACSIPCFQEFYNVYYLSKSGYITNDALFIPGYSGDFFAGSRIDNRNINLEGCSINELTNKIIQKHFKLGLKDNVSLATIQYVNDYITRQPSQNSYEIYERFDYNERQAKYIQNSVRSFEYWGYQWITPMFSKAICEFWSTIPNVYREKRKLYFEYEYVEFPKGLQLIQYHKEVACETFFDKLKLYCLKLLRPYYLHPEFALIPYISYLLCLIKRVPFISFVKDRYFHYLKYIGIHNAKE